MPLSAKRRLALLILGVLALLGIVATYGYLYFKPQISTGSEAVDFPIVKTPGGIPVTISYTPSVTPNVPGDVNEIRQQCFTALKNYLITLFNKPIRLRGDMRIVSYPNPCMYRQGLSPEGIQKNREGDPCIQVVMHACSFKGVVEGLPTYPEGCAISARIPVMGLRPSPSDYQVQIIQNECLSKETPTPTPTTPTPTYTPQPTYGIEPPEILNPDTTTTPDTPQSITENEQNQSGGGIVYYSSPSSQNETGTLTTTPQAFQSQPQTYVSQQENTTPQPTTTTSAEYDYSVAVTGEEEQEEGFIQTVITVIRNVLSSIFSFF